MQISIKLQSSENNYKIAKYLKDGKSSLQLSTINFQVWKKEILAVEMTSQTKKLFPISTQSSFQREK